MTCPNSWDAYWHSYNYSVTPIQHVALGSSLRFTRRDEDEEDEPWIAHEDEIQREMTRFWSNTGRLVPTEFTPPRPGVDRPQTLFAPGLVSSITPSRFEFVRRFKDRTQILIFTDGACLDHGGVLPWAGCAIIYRPCYPERKDDKSCSARGIWRVQSSLSPKEGRGGDPRSSRSLLQRYIESNMKKNRSK